MKRPKCQSHDVRYDVIESCIRSDFEAKCMKCNHVSNSLDFKEEEDVFYTLESFTKLLVQNES